jgi:hypothetical protein
VGRSRPWTVGADRRGDFEFDAHGCRRTSSRCQPRAGAERPLTAVNGRMAPRVADWPKGGERLRPRSRRHARFPYNYLKKKNIK